MIQFDEKEMKRKSCIHRNVRKSIGKLGDGTHPNGGIDASQWNLDRYYVICDTFLAKEVKITEMLKENAVGK